MEVWKEQQVQENSEVNLADDTVCQADKLMSTVAWETNTTQI